LNGTRAKFSSQACPLDNGLFGLTEEREKVRGTPVIVDNLLMSRIRMDFSQYLKKEVTAMQTICRWPQ